ncbi:hypothetical protein D3C72_1896840 [compost metagenome]
MAKPPQNSASTVRKKAGVPFSIQRSFRLATISSSGAGGSSWTCGATAVFTDDLGGATACQAVKKAYSWLMIISNILFDLFKRFYDLLELPWNCVTCATSSPSPKSCILAGRRRTWGSPNRR